MQFAADGPSNVATPAQVNKQTRLGCCGLLVRVAITTRDGKKKFDRKKSAKNSSQRSLATFLTARNRFFLATLFISLTNLPYFFF